MATETHRYVGTHASEVIVGDKVIPVAPGDFVTLSADDENDPHNATLLEDESLVSLKDGWPADVATSGISGGAGTVTTLGDGEKVKSDAV